MKEKYKGVSIKCDGCGQYLEGSDGGVYIMQEDEIVPICEAYDWHSTGQAHYCDECNDKQQEK